MTPPFPPPHHRVSLRRRARDQPPMLGPRSPPLPGGPRRLPLPPLPHALPRRRAVAPPPLQGRPLPSHRLRLRPRLRIGAHACCLSRRGRDGAPPHATGHGALRLLSPPHGGARRGHASPRQPGALCHRPRPPLCHAGAPPPPLLTTWVSAIIKSRIEGCRDSQETSRQLTEAALRKYALQTGQHYELHMFCGLHVFFGSEAFWFWHINFLARPKDAAGEPPIYFFAEATVPMGDDDEFLDEDIVLCCPIKPSTIACSAQYIKINHPVDKEHNGGLEEYDDDEIGNGDDQWDYNFPLVDFVTFDAQRDSATIRAIEESFPQSSDGDESVEDFWIREV